MSAVRLLTIDDAQIFRDLRLRGLKEEPQAFLQDADEFAALPLESSIKTLQNNWNYGAFLDDILVGISFLVHSKGKKLEHKGTIGGVYVAPEGRGNRFGAQLVEACIEKARELGIEQLYLSTDVTNKRTIELYQSLGFAPSGIEMHILKLADGRYVDDVAMIKFLKEP